MTGTSSFYSMVIIRYSQFCLFVYSMADLKICLYVTHRQTNETEPLTDIFYFLFIYKQYRMYQVRARSSAKPLKFRFCDTRGLEESQGIDAHDLTFLLDGNVPDGYHVSVIF